MRKVTVGLVGLAALFSGALSSASAALTMPIAPIHASNVENVRWVCGPFRCHWRPNFYSFGYYGGGPRFYGPPRFRGPGWRGGWHRGWRRW
jgi:hypothetical protein